ncbi:hypothetical protein [Candidatus Endomicrobiellum trichonymphae]|uniref:hypothetical protein n=1 Tax=Endomicrobium trichonymphae TaxID=1408204 RepID=UPI000325D649|nr:hypothetical protein [Candidatus Endomicrobium trichonymphae]
MFCFQFTRNPEKIGYVFQESALFDSLTIFENVAFGLRILTSLVVTHDMKSAYKIADRIMMLYEGKIIFSGTPEEARDTKNEYIRQFVEGSSHWPIIY